jgi:hypothetical protein
MKKFKDIIEENKKETSSTEFYRAPFKTKEEMIKYYNIKDPNTGKRYPIPMLSPSDPDYLYKYANMMWTKEHQPDLFDAIMNWK